MTVRTVVGNASTSANSASRRLLATVDFLRRSATCAQIFANGAPINVVCEITRTANDALSPVGSVSRNADEWQGNR